MRIVVVQTITNQRISDGIYKQKIEVKTCAKSDTSSSASSDDEEDMPNVVLLQNWHMIFLQCKSIKKNIKYPF